MAQFLTQKHKEEIAIGLTLSAVAKHGERMSGKFTDINHRFWTEHKKKVNDLLGIPEAKIQEIMIAGCFSSSMTIHPKLDTSEKGSLTFSPPHDCMDEFTRMRDRILNTVEFYAVNKFYHSNNSRYYEKTVRFFNDNPVVNINGMGYLSPEMSDEIIAAHKEFRGIIKEAEQFYGQISALISSVRTAEKLLEILPEAKPYLPPIPPKNNKAIIPIEAIQDVRDKLKAGVPPIAA